MIATPSLESISDNSSPDLPSQDNPQLNVIDLPTASGSWGAPSMPLSPSNMSTQTPVEVLPATIKGLLFNYFNKSEKERLKDEGLSEKRRALAKQLAEKMQRDEEELESLQEACVHLKEGMQETALGGQTTHRPGSLLIGCCMCGKIYHTINEIPPYLRNQLDYEAIGGPQNTQFNFISDLQSQASTPPPASPVTPPTSQKST